MCFGHGSDTPVRGLGLLQLSITSLDKKYAAKLMDSQKVQKLAIRRHNIKKLWRVPASVERFLRNRQN